MKCKYFRVVHYPRINQWLGGPFVMMLGDQVGTREHYNRMCQFINGRIDYVSPNNVIIESIEN